MCVSGAAGEFDKFMKGEPFTTYGWEFATPYVSPKPVMKVKGLVEIMKALVESGYCVDKDGDWWGSSDKCCFTTYMWKSCGDVPLLLYGYEPEWLEEKS